MGLFDIFGGSSSSSGGIFGPIIKDGPVNIPLPKKEEKEKFRRQIEETAEKIHPELGNIVKTANKIDDTLENFKDSVENGIMRALFSPEVEEIKLADHLFTQSVPYTHHGIYIGNNRVIHYAQDGDRISIKEDSLEIFADGKKIHRKSEEESPLSYSREKAVSRAYRRFAEKEYNLVINNCENFVRWCRNGTKNS